MDVAEVLGYVTGDLLPAWQRERQALDRIDRWMRWDHDQPHAPRRSNKEYKELADRAQVPWGDFLVSSLARTLYVEGYRQTDVRDNSTPWRIWQANGMDARQVPIHRATIGYGTAYGVAVPGTSKLTGESMPYVRGYSPRQMIALYEDPADDEWPVIAMRVATIRKKLELHVFDEVAEHVFSLAEEGATPVWVSTKEHGADVPPVVRYTHRLDLEGRASGEVEPFIPLLASLDQDRFDRLVVQRFASWIVRTIAGMVPAAGSAVEAEKQRLKVEDILVAEDPDTKFGSLPASSLDGFIGAHDADARTLAAVSSSPAYELTGTLANLSADALAAANAPKTAKTDESKHVIGERHEQLLRLGAWIDGDGVAASDFESSVRWKDTEIRSLAQAADALGKMATMLGFPVELLWEKVPGMEQADIDAAKKILEEGGGVGALVQRLQALPGAAPQPAPV